MNLLLPRPKPNRSTLPPDHFAWLHARLSQLRCQTFRALKTRNYRLFFIGQVISRSGMWIQMIAENWLVIQLGGSGLTLGVTTALQFAPLLLFSAYAGVLVDRWNRRTVLIATQCASGLLAFAIGGLALVGSIQIWMIWLAAFLLGCLNALDIPAREAFTMELAGPANVANAMALNSVVRNAARAFGPALGGGLIAWIGIGACFLLNAVSYIVVVMALVRMDTTELHRETAAPHCRGQVREGWRYVWHHPTLRTALLLTALVTACCTNFNVMITLFASHTLQQGAAAYGLLMACFGIGAVVGSLIAASWTASTLQRVVGLSLSFGLAHAVVGAAPTLAFGFLTIGVLGIASSMYLTCCASYFQRHAGDRMRGRVMALYTIAYLGTAPIGGPLVGWLAQSLGVRAGFLAAALPCVVASALVLLSRHAVKEPVSHQVEHAEGPS